MADKAPNEKMAWEDIERHAIAEIKEAEDFIEEQISERRTKSWDRYYGRPLGNEKKGRSKYVSRDVMDTIEWMLPYFITMFTAGEHKIKLKIKNQQQQPQSQPSPSPQPQAPPQQGAMQGPGQSQFQGQPPPQGQAQAQQPQMPDGDLIGEALRDKIDKDLDEQDPGRFKLYYQWFKDSLVSNTAFIKPFWFTDIKRNRDTIEGPINPQQMMQLVQDSDIEILDYEQTESSPPSFVNIKVEATQTLKDEFTCDNVPHWEFIVSPNSTDINDEFGKGHKTRVSIDYLKRVNRANEDEEEGSYFKYLDELEQGAAPEAEEAHLGEEMSSLDTERRSYEDHPDDEEVEEQGPRRMVDLIEWYDRIDENGDGYLQDVIIWVADNRLIRWQENDEGFVQFCGISPIVDCYKFFGRSWAELLEPIQNLKTVLTRRTLDNFDFSNQGRWRVSENANVDIKALLNNAPGEVIRANKDELESIGPNPMDTQTSLALLNYADQQKEERSGVSRLSQGKMEGGGGAMQQGQVPDRGIQRLMTAAQQRLDMVARVFAETGLKDFYRKAAWLYQRHLSEPFTANIRGQEVQITPEMLQGEIVTQASLSIETAIGQQDSQKIQQIFQFLGGVAQSGYQAIMAPDKVYRLCQQYISGLGWSNTDEFLPGLQEFMQSHQQQQQQQQQEMQAQQKAQQQQLQLEEMDRQIKQMDTQIRAKTEQAKIQQDERESLRDYTIKAMELMKEGKNEEAQQIMENAKLKLEAVNNERDRADRQREAAARSVQGGQGRSESAPAPQNSGVSPGGTSGGMGAV